MGLPPRPRPFRGLPGTTEGSVPREALSARVGGAGGDSTYQSAVHQGVVAEPGERRAVRRPPPAAQAQAQRAARAQQRGAQQQRAARRGSQPRPHAHAAGYPLQPARKVEPRKGVGGGGGRQGLPMGRSFWSGRGLAEALLPAELPGYPTS